MKIATWNVERLKHKNKLDKILFACAKINADILVLTETDTRIQLDYNYCFQTSTLAELEPNFYKQTEIRIAIYTNYELIRQYTTYDNYTTLCVELATEQGNLLVYGNIIGAFGNRHSSFNNDLLKQVQDFKRLSVGENNLCICGDFNCSFSDNYYYTKFARSTLIQSFTDNNITLLTTKCAECIDHIAVSNQFLTNKTFQINEWNMDKTLSDHKRIAVNLPLFPYCRTEK